MLKLMSAFRFVCLFRRYRPCCLPHAQAHCRPDTFPGQTQAPILVMRCQACARGPEAGSSVHMQARTCLACVAWLKTAVALIFRAQCLSLRESASGKACASIPSCAWHQSLLKTLQGMPVGQP